MPKQLPPLAFRVRPVRIDDLLGQDEAKAMLRDFARGNLRSVLLWGPPGSGKTSVASIVERLYPDSFFTIHAVTGGVQEIRKVTGRASQSETKPIVFIDEIHRFNRVQQDALLPSLRAEPSSSSGPPPRIHPLPSPRPCCPETR
ncbi:MAG TPA: AAA family ATPase [Deltaproteobacteria bacterium]|nr:AAA family ATPase [Deltaproteobacteria bacterium]